MFPFEEEFINKKYQEYQACKHAMSFAEFLTSLKPIPKQKRERIGRYSGKSKLRIEEGYKK